jgi:signal transduction histidine kinase
MAYRPRRLRASLRVNALLMVLAMLVLPQLIVVGWSLMERDIGGRLRWETRVSADQAADLLEGPAAESPESRSDELARIASQWGTRIRVIDEAGQERFDIDADRSTDLVHQIGTLFFGPDGAPTLRELDETLGPVPTRPEVVKVTGWGSPPDAPQARPPTPVSTAFRDGAPPPPAPGVESGCRTSPAGKLLVCHGARAVTIDGQRHVVYAQESSRRAVRALYDLRYHLGRLSMVMLPFALLFSWWMGRRMTQPIEWLRARVLEKAKSQNARADLELRGGDEVGDLAEAFNGLLGSLDERRRANEAFVADLVHELKNPVSAIRVCAESLESGAVDAKRAARLAKILSDSSGRLDALVSQFLELARAEAGMPNEQRTEVDVAALARGVVAAVEPSHGGVRFEIQAPERAFVSGVSPRLHSLVRNLVDNAASFAGDGGTVEVRVRRDDVPGKGGRVVLEVADTGPGISEENLPRVFDRFFTTRAVRPRPGSEHAPGTGLGLALVKAVAEAHGGEVTAQSRPGAGATFAVALPAS